MATPKPQRSPEEIEDIILRKIFLVTLAENPGGTASDQRLVYLQMTAAEILSEGKSLKLSRDLMERVLIDRLSGDFPNAETPFEYLVGCYRRAHEESKKISNMKDKTVRAEMESVTWQAKKLSVSYCRIHLGNPNLFNSGNVKSSNASPLLPLIYSEVSSGMIDGFGGSGGSSGVQSPPGFLEELFRDSDFDSLDPILKGLYEDLRGSVLKVSALGNFQQPLRALLFLVSFPVGAKSLVNHRWWIPKELYMNGRVIEMTSILVPFFHVSALPDHNIFKSLPDVGLLVLFLVIMMVSSCCVAGPRKAAVGGIFGQQQHVEKEENAVEAKHSIGDSLSKSIDNHHSIPRQDWDSNSSPGNGGNNNDK